MAKYGKILNIYADLGFDSIVTDEQGNYICDIPIAYEQFNLKDSYGSIHLKLDMETGVILNWKELTKEQIVDLIKKYSK